MDINISQAAIGGVAASVAWFIAGGALYQNPIVAKIYKDAETSPALKKWSSVPQYIFLQFVGIVIQCMLWAFVFALVKPVLPESLFNRSVMFGLILFATKIIPRLYDMWIQTTYPNKLLAVEFINGTIGCFIIGAVFSYIV